ncbi:MAG: cob(I)yrinic acid a,c-diamide adenosyltransferase [Phycisphaerales bacterium]|nr:cob(I)yrinic acid a,c-diamide adenosyltransferase [Phycisphaerales bacterium]
MKLYTKTGDDGSTGLYGSGRVMKHHPRIEAYGTVDELNAWLGMCVIAGAGENEVESRMRAILIHLQSRLFDLGADLATPAGSAGAAKVARIAARHVAEVEAYIDEIDGANEPIRVFVLPGGTTLAAHLHVARTVCRRAERLLVAFNESEPIGGESIQFLNRLSDLFFAMARRANGARGIADVAWQKDA